MSEEGQRTLKGIAILAGLPAAAIDKIETGCRWHEFAANQQIIDRASDSRDVYFVVRGRVRVVNFSYSGREVSYDEIEAGSLFGELAALDGAPRSANVVALSDTTVAVVPPAAFLDILKEQPDFAFAIMRRLVGIIRGSTDRIMGLSTLAAPERVRAELLRMARLHAQEEDTATIRPFPVHGEIASRAGTSRETVARTLGELTRNGIIERREDGLLIPNLERLEDLVEDA